VKRSLLALVVAGCTNDVDPAWQLDHDRVIAVRATPPHITSGQTSELAALLGFKGAPPAEADPDTLAVVSPTNLASIVSRPGAHWVVTAPSDAQIAAARTQLGLATDAPVPAQLRMVFANGMVGLKVVWLGDSGDNPVLGPVMIDGADQSAATSLTVGKAVDVPTQVDFDIEHYDVNWLTSCGTMHDFDLAKGYLRVEPEDPQSGTFAVVVRDKLGGVAWQLWPISAQ